MKKRKPARPSSGEYRRHWRLAPGTVFLNHGSFGACPEHIQRLQTELRRQMEAEPIQFLWRRYEERLEPARVDLARFIGARPRDVVFVTNATTGVNAVARSIQLHRGDELLTTNVDYNACRNALAEVARKSGAKLVIANIPFPLTRAEDAVAAVLNAVTRRTRLVMLDHVTSNTALILPVERIIRELDARSVDTLVDGAHAPGMLPLNLTKLRPAYYTGNLHKWVCAPKGAAFLWAREDKQADLQPAVVSHGNNTHRPGFTHFQDRFDWAGTADPSPWLCVGEAIRWLGSLLPGGWREVRKRNHDKVVAARRMLCERLGVNQEAPENLLGSMATIALPERFQGRPLTSKLETEQVRLYDKFGIEVPFVRIGDRKRRYFRISAQLYNTPAEYEYLAEALARL